MANSQLGKIGHSAETTEALPDDAPFALILGVVFCQTLANSFTVTDDTVRTEVFQILGLLDSITAQGERLRGDC